MYRTNDPRLRRRLNEIGQTLENANESAQSNIYIFTQTYVKPCLESVALCLTGCVDASCPSLNLNQRNRLRRQRGRGQSRGGAELNFDFYDDWDEDESDALLGWGDDDLDHLIGGGGGYGTLSPSQPQPQRQRGMAYTKGRRKSGTQQHDGDAGANLISGNPGLLARLFGGREVRYKPSAAGLQEHPGARRLRRDITEGEALLAEHSAGAKQHRRSRSGTASSGQTSDSLSSRGDIFPSDEEDDAIPLDDEFAMVLERRTTTLGNDVNPDSESGSSKLRDRDRKHGSRRSLGHRTVSSPSSRRGKSGSRTNSSMYPTQVDETAAGGDELEVGPQTMAELKQEEGRAEQEQEEDVERKREDARRLETERGLSDSRVEETSGEETTVKPIPIEEVGAAQEDKESTDVSAPSTSDINKERYRDKSDLAG